METIKTALVVVLLMAVLYGVYVILNKPTEPLHPEIAWHNQQIMEPLEVDLGGFESALPPSQGSPAEVKTPIDFGGTPDMPVDAVVPSLPNDDPSLPSDDANVANKDAPVAVSGQAPPDFIEPSASSAEAIAAAPTPVQAPSSYYAAEAVLNLNTVETVAEPVDAALPDNVAVESAAPGQSSFDLEGQFATESQLPTFSPFQNGVRSALSKIEDEQWYDALWTLSLFYNSPDLNAEQQQQLLDWLDPLAAKVIYSSEHLIEPAYQVQRGETIQEIAERYAVPSQLLANINGLENPQLVPSGTSLKIVRGPFRADVDLAKNELTLFAGKLYAGRFPITIGIDREPEEGEFTIRDKLPGRTFYAGDGMTIPSGDPGNPFGSVWFDLGQDISIHGSAQSETGEARGCISLSPLDANDVFAILAKGSTVLIRR